MHSPTPPTKPTPPTPPSMTHSIKTNDTHTPPTTTTTPPATAPAKATTSSIEKSPPATTATAAPDTNTASQATTNNIPPLGSYSEPSKETASGTNVPPATPIQKNTPSSMGFSIFFVFVFIIASTLIIVHLWKKAQERQKPIVDYSAESSDEIVNLILSQDTPESIPQSMPKPPPKAMPKKLVPKTESKSNTKSSFEVRI